MSARRFLLRFSLVATTLLTVYYFPYDPRGLPAALCQLYLATYAHIAGGAVSLFDATVHVTGTHIVGRTSLEFALNCDAMDVYLLFAAATLAFPARWRARALVLAIAFVGLVFVNIVRIVSLYFVGTFAPSKFDLVHLQLWPLAIVLFASGGFLAWARAAHPGTAALERAGHATVQP